MFFASFLFRKIIDFRKMFYGFSEFCENFKNKKMA